ncbi:MAG TPA: hypothetical protein VHX65_08465 [Pirellulales bacterium]|jgi:hypothetical protein|nr:hypothetical protein [Pirellulales bacterium]
MDRNIEFYVHGLVEGESGKLRFVGRCCADTIQVGDFFESVFAYEFATDSAGSEVTAHVHPEPLHLRIARIHAYGQFLDLLGTGMTGTLDLEGSGQELVRPGLVLGGESVAANGQTAPADVKSSTAS